MSFDTDAAEEQQQPLDVGATHIISRQQATQVATGTCRCLRARRDYLRETKQGAGLDLV